MIYLYCERCHEKRLFFPCEEQPPFDPHSSLCSECGFSFGYRQETTHGPHGRVEVTTRPVLERHVVLAGLEEFHRSRVNALRAIGLSIEHQIARQKFDGTAGDLKARQQLTSSATGSLDPSLAERILRPQVVPKTDG